MSYMKDLAHDELTGDLTPEQRKQVDALRTDPMGKEDALRLDIALEALQEIAANHDQFLPAPESQFYLYHPAYRDGTNAGLAKAAAIASKALKHMYPPKSDTTPNTMKNAHLQTRPEDRKPSQDMLDLFNYAPPSIKIEKITAIYAHVFDESEGYGAGEYWWVVRYGEDEYGVLHGGCDTTGWDCQSWSEYIGGAASPEEAIDNAHDKERIGHLFPAASLHKQVRLEMPYGLEYTNVK